MELKIEKTAEKDTSINTPVLIVPMAEDHNWDLYSDLDNATNGLIGMALSTKEFTGKFKQFTIIHTRDMGPKRIALVGLGKKNNISAERLRKAAGSAIKKIRALSCEDVALSHKGFEEIMESDFKADYPPVFYFLEGATLALYKFTKYKTPPTEPASEISSITVLGNIEEEHVNWLNKTVSSVYYTRNLVNTPAKDLTPTTLSEEAKLLEGENVKVHILEKEDVEKEGMGSYLSVSMGSSQPLKFIVIEYIGAEGEPIALVGKSVTFDSGGLSIKPSSGMEDMKYDMAGGGAVLGTLKAVIALKMPLHIVAVLPATENMVNGYASKPGDVVRAITGKTIEVLNTDAEGRLALADAIGYVIKHYNPRFVVDIATLTGACSIALGHEAIAIVGTDSELVDRFKKAGNETYERVWEMPLFDEYKEYLKSDVADLKNIGGRAGGVITAGYFLKEFTGKTPWVHLDIASTAWTSREKDYVPKCATGIGVRLFLNFLRGYKV